MSSIESSDSCQGLGLGGSSQQLSSPGLISEIQSSPVRASVSRNRRRTRILKACERCRIKKVKCEAGTPCTLCKEDGTICSTSSKKRPRFESVPRAQRIEKLYIMLRKGEAWELDEPELNDYGMPIIHDVPRALGCIRRTQEDSWSLPGRHDTPCNLKSKSYLPDPEFGRDEPATPSQAHCSPLKRAGLSTPCTGNPQEYFSPFWKHQKPEHEELQQKPDFILCDVLMQESQDYLSDSPFFPMELLDSSPDEYSILDEIASPLMSNRPTGEMNWTTWRDLLH
ncbi:hypothetical protein BJ875DRAFT_446816 [Amylocarpus encephaloides]|uniref:Zn(2)-C6 fungal-type domain-containing protein n=1 Tax=Amylocarpus encephaloides TaxID=45428 RepID=A0A9P8BZN2_9HELO|nr:hypothetical protein BJ875DRAFT_446816 [Amylocarpus encephaloides]